MKYGSLFCLLMLFSVTNILGQQSYQYYYLAIGNGNYEQNSAKFTDPEFVPYDNLPEALLSAQLMQGVFEKFIHAKGKTVMSSVGNMITKNRVLKSLDELDIQIKKDKASNPFVIFYYCGHGISENLAWNQFMIPGNYTTAPGNQRFDDLMDGLIFLGDITDFFFKRKYPYMVLLDCCRREEKDNSFPEKQMNYFFSQQNVETFKTLAQVLKNLNEYHQPDPVVFAIAPGSVAPTVTLPDQKLVEVPTNSVPDVGPLCRRSLIALDAFNNSLETILTVADLVRILTDAKFDTLSSTSVSFYEDDPKHAKELVFVNKGIK